MSRQDRFRWIFLTGEFRRHRNFSVWLKSKTKVRLVVKSSRLTSNLTKDCMEQFNSSRIQYYWTNSFDLYIVQIAANGRRWQPTLTVSEQRLMEEAKWKYGGHVVGNRKLQTGTIPANHQKAVAAEDRNHSRSHSKIIPTKSVSNSFLIETFY